MSEEKQAVILFAHGARDARWSRPLGALTQAVRQRLPQAFVAPAFLEFQPPTLNEALDEALAAGCTRISVLPVFWASGGHVAGDVPPLLAVFRRRHPDIALALLPVLSELPGMIDFIADCAAQRMREPPA